jgi:hypothetical protein
MTTYQEAYTTPSTTYTAKHTSPGNSYEEKYQDGASGTLEAGQIMVAVPFMSYSEQITLQGTTYVNKY